MLMTIVLNEEKWVERQIQQRTLGKKPYITLGRLSKHHFAKGLNKSQVKDELCNFLLACDPSVSLPKWESLIDNCVNYGSKHKPVQIDYIPITKSEMDVIDSLAGVQLRRLAFTLLCLAKYWNIVNETDGGWVNNADTEIMKMANVNTSLKRQGAMYHTLYNEGLIQFSKKVDNTNVRVLYADDKSETVLRITDFRNLGYQYLMNKGGPYFICENCGLATRYSNPEKGKKQKYCMECARLIKMQNNINSMLRLRRTKREASEDNNANSKAVSDTI